MATWAQKVTIKYPAVYLLGRGARADILSVALAGAGQAQDAGGKVIHVAPDTTSTITSKSISKDGGHATRRRLLKVAKGAINAKSLCAATPCLLDVQSRSNTYPSIEIDEEHADIGHEATVSRLSDEQVFYLQSRGLSETEAKALIVNGFFDQFTKELPMEYAVELNRLITLQMEGSIG
jgi:Fe-S cluster assembly protein SufB